jgi:hypothetical protein
MDPMPVRVVLEHRAEGALCRVTLSPSALAELQQDGALDLRLGDEGVFLGALDVTLKHGGEEIELVRCELEVTAT